MEQGTIKLNNKGSGYVKIGKRKQHAIPSKYKPVPLEYRNKECEVEFEGHMIQIIHVNGKELPINTEKLKEQEVKRERQLKEQEVKRERQRRKQENEMKYQEDRKRNKGRINKMQSGSLNLSSDDHFFLPSDTYELLTKNEWMVDNFQLKLGKGARLTQTTKGRKFSFFKKGYKKDPGFKVVPDFGEFPFVYNAKRHQKSAESLLGKEQLSIKDYKTQWNFALGLGNESVYETSLTLHELYGIPYIPASALKGALRNWIISTHFAGVNTKEKDFPLVNAEYWALRDESFCRIFGCPAEVKKVRFEDDGTPKKGKNRKYTYWKAKETALGKANKGEIIFFDSFPTSEPTIEPDILNNHYPDYYSKSKKQQQPTDMQSPNPVLFLVVKNTTFRVIIGSRERSISEYEIGGKKLDFWIKDMLQTHGIGAKTAVGYGFLTATTP